MRELKVAAGIWYLGATGDRFVKEGYRDDKSIRERFELAASVEGVSGLEMHYPTEITDDNYKEMKKLADDLGLEIVQFCPHLWVDPRWKFGQFTNPDPKLRQEALDLVKRTTDIAQHMEAHIMVYWPAQDGYDYHFQIDQLKVYDWLVENMQAWADYAPQQKIVIEYKGYEPRSNILLPNMGSTMLIVNDIDRDNVGVNLDVGHAIMAGENLAEAFALCLRYDKLFHTHWNDNWGFFDDDLMVGTIDLWGLLEALFWLDEVGYDDWFGLDLFPYREDPVKCIEESINMLKFGFEMLDRVDRDEIRECFKTCDAIKIAQLQRKMLGASF